MKRTYAVRDGKVVEITDEPVKTKARAFHINTGKGGLTWLSKSANKTWINKGQVVKTKQGDPTNQK